MKKILPVICFLLISFFVKGQNDEIVKNIRHEFSGIKMIITYDLISLDGKTRTYDIQTSIKVDGKEIETEQGLSSKKQETTGRGKQIVWYYSRDGQSEEELDVNSLRISVFASNPNPPIEKVVIKDIENMKQPEKTPNPTVKNKDEISNTIAIVIPPTKKPSLVLPIAVSAVGLGGSVVGLLQWQEAESLYADYKATYTVRSDENGEEYKDYKKANDKYKMSQYVGIGGGVLLGTGAYLLFKKMKKRNSDKYSVKPILDDAMLFGSYGGVGVTFHF